VHHFLIRLFLVLTSSMGFLPRYTSAFLLIFVLSALWKFTLDRDQSLRDEADAGEPAMNMIRRWGYPAEKHDVHTQDGFILTMFRIRHGRFSDEKCWWCHRPVVVFFHGLMASGTEFFLNPPESSLAFILADAGFDVFIINHRGTTYSKRHTTLKPTDNEFWRWTMDELSKYDCPAAIDKALEISGQKTAYWVGHSMGTTVGYMMLSTRPEYHSKIKALFQLAPTGTAGFAVGPIGTLFSAYSYVKSLFYVYRRVYGAHEFGNSLPLIYPTFAKLCLRIPFKWQVLYLQ
ncbi:hypothetical protein PMAYCL1PPCAC_20382, partial [Pristionchus mayeri]